MNHSNYRDKILIHFGIAVQKRKLSFTHEILLTENLEACYEGLFDC